MSRMETQAQMARAAGFEKVNSSGFLGQTFGQPQKLSQVPNFKTNKDIGWVS